MNRSPLKLHIVSDTHNEIADFELHGVAYEADVVILAGDIGNGMHGLTWAAKLLQRTDAHVLYVPGNHEFYRHDIGQLRKAMRSFCAAPKGWSGDDSEHRLHLLDNDEVVIKGTRFLGSTLWTDFKLFGQKNKEDCLYQGAGRLNDFRLIRNGEWNFTPNYSITLHEEAVDWLEQKLKNETHDGPTVVVTHHLPSRMSVVDRFKKDLLSACFASDLDHLMGYSEAWIHGHTHDSLDYTVNGTRVICNPRGYSRYEGTQENDEFNHALLVEVSKNRCEIVSKQDGTTKRFQP